MKSSTLCIVALFCFALAGQGFAQTAADAYRKAGAAYFKAGQFRDSARAYQQVIRLKPNDSDAYHQLGEAYSRLGMNAEASQAFEKEADLLVSGSVAAAPSPARKVTQPAQNARLQAQTPPPVANGQRKYKAGQRVEYVYNGKWFKAIIVKVASDANVANFGPYHVYRVHSLGYNE